MCVTINNSPVALNTDSVMSAELHVLCAPFHLTLLGTPTVYFIGEESEVKFPYSG